jgi:hypothetical protein
MSVDFNDEKIATIIKNAIEVDEELNELCTRTYELKGTTLFM